MSKYQVPIGIWEIGIYLTCEACFAKRNKLRITGIASFAERRKLEIYNLCSYSISARVYPCDRISHMLPTAHTSVGFLISQIRIKGKSLSTLEIVFVVFCANVFDLDLFFVYLGGQKIYHHLLVTHTPLFSVVLILVFYLIYKVQDGVRRSRGIRRIRISPKVFLLGFIAMLSHFVLDDLSYWLYLLGIAIEGKPEIFWLFPFDSRRTEALRLYSSLRPTVGGFIACYIRHPVFIFEWIFLIWGGVVFVKRYGFLVKKLFFRITLKSNIKG